MSESTPTDLNDTLFGTANNDTVDLLSGNDLYYGLDGDDSVLGNSGLDTVFGGDGADTIVGLTSLGILDGGAGNDVLIGSSFFPGNPFAGGAGDDRYIMSGSTLYLSINDSSGSDTLSYAEIQQTEVLVPYLSGVAGIEAFDLSGGVDISHLDATSIVIRQLSSYPWGVDILHLDAASVRRLSDTDVVTVFGGGADRLVLDDLASWTRGEASGGFVTFTTAIGGNATVIAAESLVPITSGPTTGNETLFGSDDDDVVNLLAGNDFYRDFNGRDSVLGGDGNDTIWGGADQDTLDGGEGNDEIIGQGDDSLFGGSGDDFLLSGAVYGSNGGVFRMSGGAGNDYIYSEGLGDTLDGGIGDDIIIGVGRYFSYGAGPDSILGGDGNDNISGGGNVLHLDGASVRRLSDTDVFQVFGGGADRLVFDDLASWTRDEASGGFVTFTTTVGGNATVIAAEALVPTVPEPPTEILGSVVNDVVALRLGTIFYEGLIGHDSILGTTGAETINGGDGDDTLHGNSGTDFLDGGAGNDMLMTNGLSGHLSGGAGDDVILVGGVTLTDIAALFGP